jgi:cytochrome oxidase Cu insertion factor (SCO1/SenC/PrrC family)
MSLTETRVSLVNNTQYNVWFVKECVSTHIDAGFNIVNSGNADGFTNVELTAKNRVIDTNRYFVKAGTSEQKYLSGEWPDCQIRKTDIEVKINETPITTTITSQSHSTVSATITSSSTTSLSKTTSTTTTTTNQAYAGGAYGSIPLKDVNDTQHFLKDYQGKVVVLEFMTTWGLTSGQQEQILKNEFYPAYNGKNVVLLSVTVDPTYDTPSTLKNHIEKKGIPWTMLRDTSLELTDYFKVTELSTTLIISPNGEVKNTFTGLTNMETLSNAVNQILSP